MTANVSNLADVDQALPISVRGGFQYGNDALANPATDPSIVQASANSDTITPKLWKLRKEYVGPEDETATGPNYVRDYRVIVDIANNQTITNLDLSDVLPSNMQFVGNVQTFIGGSLTGSTTINTPSTSTPGGTLTRRLASVTGSASDNDAELRFSYYIPRIDAGSAEVINSATGDDVLANNNASAAGSWNPIDPRDGTALALTLDPVGIEHVLTPKSIAVQKSVAVVGGGSVKPGEVLEYTIELQVSDYFAFDNLSLTDLISDGQLFDASFTPTFSVNEHGVSNSANFGAGNFNVFTDTPTPGEDTITFDLSGQLSSMALNSQLVGVAFLMVERVDRHPRRHHPFHSVPRSRKSSSARSSRRTTTLIFRPAILPLTKVIGSRIRLMWRAIWSRLLMRPVCWVLPKRMEAARRCKLFVARFPSRSTRSTA